MIDLAAVDLPVVTSSCWPVDGPVLIHCDVAAPISHHTGATPCLEMQAWGPPPGSAPTIVLMHEGLGCIDLWRDFPLQLAHKSGFGVLAYSRIGYGRSSPYRQPWPLDYMRLEARDVLPQVLAAAGVQRGWLLGHSDGASIAAAYAGTAQDHRLMGLILIAPHFFTEAVGLAAIAGARFEYLAGDLRARLQRYHQQVDSVFHGWCDAWLAAGFRDWNLEEVLDYIRVPVLAIQGDADQYGTLAQIDVMQERLYCPLQIELIPECQHSPHTEATESTLAIVAEFCRRSEALHSTVVTPR